MLAPALRPRQLVMDDLSVTKVSGRESRSRGQGRELSYLPPYSLGLNPTWQASSKAKTLPRRPGVCTRQTLLKATGRALYAVTAWEAHSFLGHRGYRIPGRPL